MVVVARVSKPAGGVMSARQRFPNRRPRLCPAWQLNAQARRLDRLNRQIHEALHAMRNGASLRLQYSRGGPDRHLTNGTSLRAEVARAVVTNPHVVPVDHALFKDLAAQTWRWVDHPSSASKE